jgi:hypothetical protein
MTSRSPGQHSQSTTVSRRLRYPVDQNLSVRPPEVPRLRNVRPHRAATLLEPRHDQLDPERQVPYQLPVNSSDEDFTVDPQPSSASQLVNVGALSEQVTQYLARNLEFSPHSSPQGFATLTAVPQGVEDIPLPPYFASGFPPSPLPSVTGSLDFEVPLPGTDLQQSHTPFLDLQDMRSVIFEMLVWK